MSGAPAFHVLSLDGGGAKGMYTLGILRELERMLGGRLSDHFQLIYGTSTGAIIAASLGVEMGVEEIVAGYRRGIPGIMKHWSAAGRSADLAAHLKSVFGARKFDAFVTDVCIVAANTANERALIFKTQKRLAHGLKDSFDPGFGQTIALAVQASCSAYPFFLPVNMESRNTGPVELIDGGFVAANPSFFALTDAVHAVGEDPARVRFLSLGVGTYPVHTPRRTLASAAQFLFAKEMITRQFSFSANTQAQLFTLHARGLAGRARIDGEYADGRYATSMFETRPERLNAMLALGRASFERQEPEIREALGLPMRA